MFSDPWIVQYHDVMTDSEVARIKELAKPRVSIIRQKFPQKGKVSFAKMGKWIALL